MGARATRASRSFLTDLDRTSAPEGRRLSAVGSSRM